MPIYSKESLETLRQRVDLVDVLSSHMDLKRSGAAYKGLCPFHDEKSPSFMVQKGDTHYHCYGCGAHGDAIAFLMNRLKMSFSDSVENLARQFQVHLELAEESYEPKGPAKAQLKEALEYASEFYHFCLLHTEEGHKALKYLYARGIDLEFIRQFQVGLSPERSPAFRALMKEKHVSEEILVAAGLLSEKNREFFTDRIMFPIREASGAVIGFSGRKYKEETFGGKYVNTSETSLFKKSRVLFGLNYSRKRIAKERQAIVVEGQIDALKLIHYGFNITVAGQGTAFGEGHVKELTALGINQVYLALDSDLAGQEATAKIGNFFQKDGVEVKVVTMPNGFDPDLFLREKGPEAFAQLLENAGDYLSFLVNHLGKEIDVRSPAGKNELVNQISKQIRAWDHPLMVHESLRKLASLTQVPESMIGVGEDYVPNILIRKHQSLGLVEINPDRVLESDLLRWLMIGNTEFLERIQKNIHPTDFHIPVCRKLYEHLLILEGPIDLLSLAVHLEDQELITELTQKKINKEKAEEHFNSSLQRLLDRNWMEKREQVKIKIQAGEGNDDEVLALVQEFDHLKKNPPKVQL